MLGLKYALVYFAALIGAHDTEVGSPEQCPCGAGTPNSLANLLTVLAYFKIQDDASPQCIAARDGVRRELSAGQATIEQFMKLRNFCSEYF